MAELAASELGERSVEPCRGVRVELRRIGDDDLNVTLSTPSGTISRRVSSVADAVFWVQSWLEPDFDEALAAPHRQSPRLEAPEPSTEAPRALPAPPSARASGAHADGVRATLGLAGRTSLDTDGANWNGVEFFGDVEVAAPLWIGAGLGRSWDYVLGGSALGASIERVTTHAIVRAGGAWPIASRAQWSLGLGAGVMSAFVRGAPLSGGGLASDDEGVGVLELSSGLRWRPTRRLGLRCGLELARTVGLESADAREPGEPLQRVEPSWSAGLVFGLGLSLGQE